MKLAIALWLAGLALCLLLAGTGYAETVTFTWDPPTTNTDGSAYTDHARYELFRGAASGERNQATNSVAPPVEVWLPPAAVPAWTASDLGIAEDPLRIAVAWSACPAAVDTSYWTCRAVNSQGCCSADAPELVYSRTNAVVRYELCWSLTEGDETNVVATTTGTSATMDRADLPKRWVWVRPRAVLATGQRVAYAAAKRLKNTVPVAPGKMEPIR